MDEPLLLFETLHGSRAFGLDRPGSDEDLKGVIVGPRAWYFGLAPAPEQLELTKDHVRFELRKLLRLALAANPSVLEMLFADPSHHRVVHPLGEKLLGIRERFLTKQVAGTFGGYALSQLGRIRRHRRWLLEPPSAAPRRSDFGLSESSALSRDQLGAAEALLERSPDAIAEAAPNFLAILDAERRFRAATKEWSQYQRWQRERNPARAALEKQFGYDTKHAMHLVRLSRMALEILETGEVRVRRTDDRDELLAIRDGALSYDELVARADALGARIQAAKEASPLPEKPDEMFVNDFAVSLIREALAC